MLHIYTSESLDALADQCSDKLRECRSGDPFHSPWVVVQNKEVRQWLSLQASTKNSIFANVEFVLPSELIWRLYRLYKPETPKVLPTDRNPLQWRIYEFLISADSDELNSINEFPGFEDERQAFQLAAQIADVFDLYQMYRPDMTESWKQGKLTTSDPSERWQLWLWRELYNSSMYEMPDRGEAFYELFENLERGTAIPDKLPQNLFLLGLSHFSLPFAMLIKSLSRHSETYFFTQEIKVASQDIFSTPWNDLINQWGSLKIESSQLISSEKDKQPVLTVGQNLYSIFKQLSSDRQAREVVEIHSCHNPRREVEVLKDRLLSHLEDKILPEDVLILVPDMQEYAPLIKSVFSFNEDEPDIPVFAPSTYIDPEQRSLTELLDFLYGDHTANEFIDLIESELFRSRFDFTEDDLSEIRKWMITNRIHYGIDRLESSFSMEKLQLALFSGYSSETTGFETIYGIAPDDQISSSEQLNLISRFSSCVNLLIDMQSSIGERKSTVQWMDLISGWITQLRSESVSLTAGIARLAEQLKVSGSDRPIDFGLMKSWLGAQLMDIQATSSGLGRGVVLSSYIPYRNIPFKFIAVLGLNESVFPRNPVRPEFDLINNDPKPGERITRKDDELLFLEVLNAAQEKLYISYLGQDQHSENERLPSVLIQKLMDVIEESGDKIDIQREKLHGFNPKYFLSEESFSERRKKLSMATQQGAKAVSTFFDPSLELSEQVIPEEVSVHQFVNFFTHPARYFLKQQIGIREGKEEGNPEDRELFSMDGLSTYLLDDLIASGIESGYSNKELKQYFEARGYIPQGIPGERVFNQEWNQINEIWTSVAELRTEDEMSVEVQLELDELRIQGTIGNIYGNKLILWRPGKERAKDLVQTWLYHLMLLADYKSDMETFLITKDSRKQKVSVNRFGAVQDADTKLTELSRWFVESHQQPGKLCFFPESSKAYYEATLDTKYDPIEKARKEWLGSDYSRGEVGDFYNKLLWRGYDPVESEPFSKISEIFWKPLFDTKSGGTGA